MNDGEMFTLEDPEEAEGYIVSTIQTAECQ